MGLFDPHQFLCETTMSMSSKSRAAIVCRWKTYRHTDRTYSVEIKTRPLTTSFLQQRLNSGWWDGQKQSDDVNTLETTESLCFQLSEQSANTIHHYDTDATSRPLLVVPFSHLTRTYLLSSTVPVAIARSKVRALLDHD
jgi:hypothetical protein